jgi:hypothetical protein
VGRVEALQLNDRGNIMSENNSARDYALLIKAEIVALDTILENWSDIAGIPEYDANIDETTLDEIKDSLIALELEWPEYDDADIVGDYLNGTCLDVDIWRKVGDSDGATRIEILRTCGGPRCDILRDSDDGSIVEIRVHCGSDSHTLRVNAGTLADYLDTMAGGF